MRPVPLAEPSLQRVNSELELVLSAVSGLKRLLVESDSETTARKRQRIDAAAPTAREVVPGATFESRQIVGPHEESNPLIDNFLDSLGSSRRATSL